jgi:hypothetical protein
MIFVWLWRLAVVPQAELPVCPWRWWCLRPGWCMT